VNPSDRALLRAIAGPDATKVSTAQILDAADGLVGRPHDGSADALEMAALKQIALDTHVSPALYTKLNTALARVHITIAVPQRPATLKSRLPAWLDMTTLKFAGREAPNAKIFTDAHGNRMKLVPDTDSPVWLAASFAKRRGTFAAKPMSLSTAEADALGLQMARQQLAKAKAAIAPMPHEPHVDKQLTTTPSLAEADNARDLNDFIAWSPVHEKGMNAYLVLLSDGTRARLIADSDKKSVNISYSSDAGKSWGSPRLITSAERLAVMTTNAKHEVIAKLSQRYAAESAVSSIIWEASLPF
jgi:hypothetical protein